MRRHSARLIASLVLASACASAPREPYEPRLLAAPESAIEYDFALIECRAEAGRLIDTLASEQKAAAAGGVAFAGGNLLDGESDLAEMGVLLLIAGLAYSLTGMDDEEAGALYRDSIDECLAGRGYAIARQTLTGEEAAGLE